jgi:hypothetical protein
MAATSKVISGIKLAFDDTHYANVTEVLTLDMRQGAVTGSTRHLDGAAGAAGAYPGSLTGFQATNTDTTNTAGGGLKMMIIKYDKSRTNADPFTFSSNDDSTAGQVGVPFTKIVAVLGHVNGAANDHDIVTFTDTVLTLTAEAAAANNHITLLLE